MRLWIDPQQNIVRQQSKWGLLEQILLRMCERCRTFIKESLMLWIWVCGYERENASEKRMETLVGDLFMMDCLKPLSIGLLCYCDSANLDYRNMQWPLTTDLSNILSMSTIWIFICEIIKNTFQEMINCLECDDIPWDTVAFPPDASCAGGMSLSGSLVKERSSSGVCKWCFIEKLHIPYW